MANPNHPEISGPIMGKHSMGKHYALVFIDYGDAKEVEMRATVEDRDQPAVQLVPRGNAAAYMASCSDATIDHILHDLIGAA